jgi:hypothetical protein
LGKKKDVSFPTEEVFVMGATVEVVIEVILLLRGVIVVRGLPVNSIGKLATVEDVMMVVLIIGVPDSVAGSVVSVPMGRDDWSHDISELKPPFTTKWRITGTAAKLRILNRERTELMRSIRKDKWKALEDRKSYTLWKVS